MGHANGIITTPINVREDIASMLGRATGDVGQLCGDMRWDSTNQQWVRANATNKWSKMKPVAFPYVEPDRTQPVSAYGKTLWWWKGKPSQEEVAAGLVIGNYTTTAKCMWFTICGVKFLGFSSAIDALRAFNPVGNLYDGASNNPLAQNFSYVPPRGGINDEPYRVLDFNNYIQNYPYVIIPDFGTESATKRVVVKDGSPNNKVRCSIMSYASLDTGPSGLSFNDLFCETGQATFTALLGELSGNTLTVVSASIAVTANDDFYKEVEIDLNASQLWNKTIIALYCAVVPVGQISYYVPVMQSNNLNHCWNTPITYAPNRRVYNSWYVERSTTPYYAMSFTQKQNYGSSFAWGTVVGMSSFMTNGAMNRWYLKVEIPRDSATTYTYTNASFELEFAGQFIDANGSMTNVYYTIDSSTNNMVLRNTEVTSGADWGPTENVVVTNGSGTQTAYLAIYNLFNDHGGVVVTKGGTVWRITLHIKNGNVYRYVVVYGAIDGSSSQLSINVPMVTA